MRGSVPSLEEIKNNMIVFFIFSLLAISFWTWIYYNMGNIIKIFSKNLWTTLLLSILFVIVPWMFLHFIANSLNKNVSFLRSLGVSLLSNIIYIIISLIIIIFAPLVILILFICLLCLLMAFIFIYAHIFHVNWMDAFKIVSTYAFISALMIILIIYFITFNHG